jgi:hypothetical protein
MLVLLIFNKQFLLYISIEALRDPNKKKVAFSNFLRTDGFAADVVLTKRANKNDDEFIHYAEQDVGISLLGGVVTSLELSDVSRWGIDPNRGQIFVASYGEGEDSHQIRRCSTREYCTYTGSKRYEKRERKRMSDENMEDILLNVPSAKTVSISRYLQYVTYILLHLRKILAIYHASTAEDRFHLYQGVQRAREEMVNILVNGGRKYNKSKRKNLKKNREKNNAFETIQKYDLHRTYWKQ